LINQVKIGEQYGNRLAFYGGVNKHVLGQSRGAIRRELEYKVPPMLATGGCVLALDPGSPMGPRSIST